jgi:hypothetical protein
MSEFDRPNSVYSKALDAVKNKQHVQVQKFQFQKQNKKNGNQLYQMTDVTVGTSVILSSSSKTYDAHREPSFNVWIWADTLEQVQESGGEGVSDDAPQSRPTQAKSTKSINRTLSLQQQKHIMTEVVFGDQVHPTKKSKIEPFQRNQHGCQGHFYSSVVAHLNASSVDSGPFKIAPATVDKTKDFVETGVIARKQVLQQKYGEKFMERKDWDTFNDRPSADEDESFETAIRDEINSMFDALVYGSHESEAGAVSSNAGSNPVYTIEDDEELASVANGGVKRKREHKLEPVKPKATNSVVQFEERTQAISKMLESLTAIMAQPDQSASVAPSGGHASSSPGFDSELKPLLASLLALPKPPGTTTTCELLATGLGRYGIIKLSELQEMDRSEAAKILTGLTWSPMQIAKVLPKEVLHHSQEPASVTNVCSICQEELVFNQARNAFENVIFTACQHGFHINCLATHRRIASNALHGENNPKCPNCNCELL